MFETHIIPEDSLAHLHKMDESCFCHPVKYKEMRLHRMDYTISHDGEILTGYVLINPLKLPIGVVEQAISMVK